MQCLDNATAFITQFVSRACISLGRLVLRQLEVSLSRRPPDPLAPDQQWDWEELEGERQHCNTDETILNSQVVDPWRNGEHDDNRNAVPDEHHAYNRCSDNLREEWLACRVFSMNRGYSRLDSNP